MVRHPRGNAMRMKFVIAGVVLTVAGGGVVVLESWDWLTLSSAARNANAMLDEAEAYTRCNAYPGEAKRDPPPKSQHAEYLEWQQRDPAALQRAIVYRRARGLWVMPFPSSI